MALREVVDLNRQIFRQYDIRGHAERDFPNETVRLLGRAFGTYVQERGISEVLAGRDNRLSLKRLRCAFVEGLLSIGCTVIDIGLVATPVLYYAMVHCGTKGGAMITGSWIA